MGWYATEPAVAFRADYPFAVLIRHNRSRSLLFLGRVIDPSG
jgi:serine protease inhibitor